jgi:hypothetical protein
MGFLFVQPDVSFNVQRSRSSNVIVPAGGFSLKSRENLVSELRVRRELLIQNRTGGNV